jgi:hypothetical protein
MCCIEYISETVPLLSVSNICQTKQSAYRSTSFMMGPYLFQNKYMSVIQKTYPLEGQQDPSGAGPTV